MCFDAEPGLDAVQLQQHPPLRHRLKKVQLRPDNVTCFSDQSVESVGIRLTASKQDGTINHSLIEYPQHRPADVKRPQALKIIETTLLIFSCSSKLSLKRSNYFDDVTAGFNSNTLEKDMEAGMPLSAPARRHNEA